MPNPKPEGRGHGISGIQAGTGLGILAVTSFEKAMIIMMILGSIATVLVRKNNTDARNDLKETTGGEFRVYRASIRLLQGTSNFKKGS